MLRDAIYQAAPGTESQPKFFPNGTPSEHSRRTSAYVAPCSQKGTERKKGQVYDMVLAQTQTKSFKKILPRLGSGGADGSRGLLNPAGPQS